MSKAKVKNTMELLNVRKQLLWVMGIFFVFANAFAAYYISQERFIYFWDFSTYFNKYVYLNQNIFINTKEALEAIFWSIRENKYNYFPALLLAPFSFIFGPSRISYILSVVNLFALPAVILLTFLIHQLASRQGKTTGMLPFIALGIILMSPDFWYPILYGFLDIGGIIATTSILLIYLSKPFNELKKRDLLVIAGLIPILVIFRRWYAFWGATFYLVLFLDIWLTSVLSKPFNKKKMIEGILKFTTMAVISAVIYFAVAPTYAQEILVTDYSDMNSAYRRSANLLQSLNNVVSSFGLLYTALFLLGSVEALINKNTRKFSLFILAQTAIIFVLFSKTQDFDTHHRYLLLPQLLIFSSLFLNGVVQKITRFKVIVLTGLTVIFMFNFSIAFGFQGTVKPKPYPTIFTDIRHKPLVRNDMKEVKRLMTTLGKLLVSPEDRVYVLASSDIINSHILASAWIYFDDFKEISEKVLATHDIDRRSGYPTPLLKADYVIVPDHVQYHMNPKDQRVVTIPTALFHQNKSIARSFKKLPYEFRLERKGKGKVKVSIYKKVKPIQNFDVLYLSELLRRHYPGREDIYKAKDVL